MNTPGLLHTKTGLHKHTIDLRPYIAMTHHIHPKQIHSKYTRPRYIAGVFIAIHTSTHIAVIAIPYIWYYPYNRNIHTKVDTYTDLLTNIQSIQGMGHV
jgi:hypothetical protein